MWSATWIDDPCELAGPSEAPNSSVFSTTRIVRLTCSISELLKQAGRESCFPGFEEGGRVAEIATADYIARRLTDSTLEWSSDDGSTKLRLELLQQSASTASRSRRRTRARLPSRSSAFMFERSDISCTRKTLTVFLRGFTTSSKERQWSNLETMTNHGAFEILTTVLDLADQSFFLAYLNHIAIAVLQERLRRHLSEINAVAFVANGSILPRKSGASNAPMSSPPAVKFQAPSDSSMEQTISIDLGLLAPFLSSGRIENGSTMISLSGLVVSSGISLIVGGGYHGKSTLLRTIAAGVYNKVPGDGREFCVTVNDAVTIRAEDGRYVNNCNISAFISNLPTPPGVTKTVDTVHFSSGEASGSTSQAANVCEAIEMGSSAFLVDEDVSAANFMARDGRMRSLVMDESITPLLYRVNGLYKAHGISSIVVVGGVGDWLDVPDSVILMDKYVCKDATKKARSVSRQFSHGHVQYAGRGVVHRLEWDKGGTPHPRRPVDSVSKNFTFTRTAVTLLDGSETIALHRGDAVDEMIDTDVEDDEDHYIDMSRCEQLLGKKQQLYACGAAVVWLMEKAKSNPELGINDLLKKLDENMDENGFAKTLMNIQDESTSFASSLPWTVLLETVGYAVRPRRFEVGQALTRLRGVAFEELPVEDDGSEARAAAEAERKRQELMEIWNNRRKKN